MRTIYVDSDSQAAALLPSVATIGFFDGVHRGHQYLIGRLRDEARRRGLASTVVTFAEHPRQVLQTQWQPQLLSTLEEKRIMLAQTGIDQLVVLRFDRRMAALTGRDFMRTVLQRQLGVQALLLGYDNRFGRGRADGFADFCRYGRELGIDVVQGDALTGGQPAAISSSFVRRLVGGGQVEQACRCLGRPYLLIGHVVHGEHVGTGLGFPTANLQPDEPLKLVPAAGVYAVRVRIDGSLAAHAGMMNIGTRPTFGRHGLTLETHIFQFDGNLYGQRIGVSFVARLREERCFDRRDELVEQLRRDAAEAATLLADKGDGDGDGA